MDFPITAGFVAFQKETLNPQEEWSKLTPPERETWESRATPEDHEAAKKAAKLRDTSAMLLDLCQNCPLENAREFFKLSRKMLAECCVTETDIKMTAQERRELAYKRVYRDVKTQIANTTGDCSCQFVLSDAQYDSIGKRLETELEKEGYTVKTGDVFTNAVTYTINW